MNKFWESTANYILIWVSFYFCKKNPVYLHMFYFTLSVFVYFSVFSCSSFSLARWPAKVGRIRPQRSRPRHHQTFHKAGPDTPADSETIQSDSWDRPPAQWKMCSFFFFFYFLPYPAVLGGRQRPRETQKRVQQVQQIKPRNNNGWYGRI